MSIRFVALSTHDAEHYRRGGPDANGQPPERAIAPEPGYPCRNCLCDIEAGAPYLTLAHRPFPAPQPYAEVGPIFLHAGPCTPGGGSEIPEFLDSPAYIVRGYDIADRIVYGTGKVVPTPEIPSYAASLFGDPRVIYAHVRSASNNC
jgi:hypothetical protein